MATITKLPSGKYRAQVRLSGNYKSKTFPKKSDAQRWAVEIERQVQELTAKGHVTPKNITVGYIIGRYLKEVPPTGRTKLATLKRLEIELGKHHPDQLDVELQGFIKMRLDGGAGGATLAGDLSFLATVLDWGRHTKKWNITGDVARQARSGLKFSNVKTRSKQRDRIPTQAELDALVMLFTENKRLKIPMADIVQFGAASCMRLGEICRIRIEDINEHSKSVIVRDRKDPEDKIGNDQDVPLVGDAWDIAMAVKGDREAGRLFPYDMRSASSAFTRACKKLKIKDLRFHDLRHFGITNLFKAGLSIPQVAVVSGHKSWENLKRYTNLTASDVHNALNGVRP